MEAIVVGGGIGGLVTAAFCREQGSGLTRTSRSPRSGHWALGSCWAQRRPAPAPARPHGRP
ncbi:FAD-binding protein [Actinomadura fibrosa]|uniref:FAD-binding protein n=1 Tax=Actinomadura fibrosa TaxID=111802 RepID=A0ABW2Y211_9ACTN